MFDISFTELMVIGAVALIVLGPEKLPRLARTVGHLAGRLQRYVADVKADINREMELEELRKMRDSMQQAATGFERSVQSELNTPEADLNKSVEALSADPAPPAARASAEPSTGAPVEAAPAASSETPAAAAEQPRSEPSKPA
jgi:sec-independent protein translocase protein TatB